MLHYARALLLSVSVLGMRRNTTNTGEVEGGQGRGQAHAKTYQTTQFLQFVFLDALPASQRLYPLVYHGVCVWFARRLPLFS